MENEILYQMDTLDELVFIPDQNIVWLDYPDDYGLFNEHLIACNQKPITLDEWQRFNENCTYCGLIINNVMVARAAVEKYSLHKWETADVRVIKAERNKGYARQVVGFVTKYILENGRSATCRTLEENRAMQKVIHSVGFRKKDLISHHMSK